MHTHNTQTVATPGLFVDGCAIASCQLSNSLSLLASSDNNPVYLYVADEFNNVLLKYNIGTPGLTVLSGVSGPSIPVSWSNPSNPPGVFGKVAKTECRYAWPTALVMSSNTNVIFLAERFRGTIRAVNLGTGECMLVAGEPFTVPNFVTEANGNHYFYSRSLIRPYHSNVFYTGFPGSMNKPGWFTENSASNGQAFDAPRSNYGFVRMWFADKIYSFGGTAPGAYGDPVRSSLMAFSHLAKQLYFVEPANRAVRKLVLVPLVKGSSLHFHHCGSSAIPNRVLQMRFALDQSPNAAGLSYPSRYETSFLMPFDGIAAFTMTVTVPSAIKTAAASVTPRKLVIRGCLHVNACAYV